MTTPREKFETLLDEYVQAILSRSLLDASTETVTQARAAVLAAYDEAATAVQGGEPVACIVDDGQERELCWWDEGYSGTITKLYAAAPPVQVKGDGYVLELLMAAGHVTPEKIAEAREIASRVAPPAARQDEGRDAARYRHIKADTSLAWICLMRREPDEWDAEIDAAMSREAQ